MVILHRIYTKLRVFSNLAVLLTALLLAPPSPVTATDNQTITLTTHNLYPYGYKSQEGEFIGSAVDVVRCVLDKMEKPYEIDVVPWKRAQAMVIKDQADGFFAGSQNSKRDKYAQMSTPIADQNWMWFLLKSSQLTPDKDIFKSQATVSSFLGANMHKWLTDNGYNVSSSPPVNTEDLLKMLLARRLDAILANDQVMAALLEKKKVSDVVKTFLNKKKPLGIYFSNTFMDKNPDFLIRFNSFVAECRNTSVRDIYEP